MKKLAAEFIGTFTLVFAGTGAIVIDETTGGTVTHVGVALTFGLVVLAMIYPAGGISGGHLNPAVSLVFLQHDAFHFAKPSHILPVSAADRWQLVAYWVFSFRKTRCWAPQFLPDRQSSHLSLK